MRLRKLWLSTVAITAAAPVAFVTVACNSSDEKTSNEKASNEKEVKQQNSLFEALQDYLNKDIFLGETNILETLLNSVSQGKNPYTILTEKWSNLLTIKFFLPLFTSLVTNNKIADFKTSLTLAAAKTLALDKDVVPESVISKKVREEIDKLTFQTVESSDDFNLTKLKQKDFYFLNEQAYKAYYEQHFEQINSFWTKFIANQRQIAAVKDEKNENWTWTIDEFLAIIVQKMKENKEVIYSNQFAEGIKKIWEQTKNGLPNTFSGLRKIFVESEIVEVILTESRELYKVDEPAKLSFSKEDGESLLKLLSAAEKILSYLSKFITLPPSYKIDKIWSLEKKFEAHFKNNEEWEQLYNNEEFQEIFKSYAAGISIFIFSLDSLDPVNKKEFLKFFEKLKTHSAKTKEFINFIVQQDFSSNAQLNAIKSLLELWLAIYDELATVLQKYLTTNKIDFADTDFLTLVQSFSRNYEKYQKFLNQTRANTDS
ncbi:hypothetical protein [Mycoplasmopsis columbinasalis]|uniref:Lipoprotein n=1 Tax=Mycoplasmopsis columbinasalis TaxID=114880 RepID=A0A449B9Y1_9BACT|nr:hypothetical protein [Mycoplasmopsis columbinasalis]VEU77967.1 Uncharacterised protein [Mycoplasmopsis columbinasalis]